MKIRLSDLLIIVFLVLISFVLKKVQFIPLIAAALAILLGSKLEPGNKNLAYIAIATLPFPPFFVFFVFYTLFIVFGAILENASFIKKFVFGTSVTLVLRLIVYHLSTLGIPISEYLILFLLIAFLSISYYIFIKKNGLNGLKNLFSLSSEDYKIMLGTLVFLFFVAHVLYNNTSLYASNGTQIYAKQFFIIDTIEKFNFFPQYDPSTGMGEQLFLTDSPTHFTKDILILATVFLKNWFGPVLVYNAYSMLILWVVILGASLILRELMPKENDNTLTVYLIILGSAAIGLSFQFVRILESFKSFSAHTINMLLFAMLLSKPKKAVEWLVIAYLMLFSYMVHVIQSIGIFVLAVSILIVLYWKDLDNVKKGINYVWNNKFKVIAVAIVFVGIMLGYTVTGYMYKDFIRESPKGILLPNVVTNTIEYFKQYVTNEGITPFSIKYPDLRRLDTKHSGFFLSIIGSLSFLYVLFNFKNQKLRKSRLFFAAFALQFVFYAVFTNFINIGNLEPGYRIIHPYTVVVLSAAIFCAINSINYKQIKIGLAIVSLAFLLHGFYYASINMSNIHSESIISKQALSQEAAVIEQIPVDGRFITYGFFANAVDAGLASATGRYFTRYQYNLWSERDNIYQKIHTQDSFGDQNIVQNLTGIELRNYMILGGYKYMLLNVCHPAGSLVIQKIYPNYTTPLYQNQENGCFVILKVNNSTYVDRTHVLKNVDPSVYSAEDGYKYISISRLDRYKFGADKIEGYNKNITQPMELRFERSNPHEVIIKGNFKEGDWVNFKEEYFPRWKAYMNGKEVPVYPSNFNMILIKATNENSITLKYDLLKIEKILNFISLIAELIASIGFILLLKYEID